MAKCRQYPEIEYRFGSVALTLALRIEPELDKILPENLISRPILGRAKTRV